MCKIKYLQKTFWDHNSSIFENYHPYQPTLEISLFWSEESPIAAVQYICWAWAIYWVCWCWDFYSSMLTKQSNLYDYIN